MNSFWKGVVHSAISAIVMYFPFIHADWLNLTVGGVITIALNWALSHTIPTTTGASAAPANHIGQ